MTIRPILSSLRYHRMTTMLIAFEIALACAVLCNACLIIAGRMRLMMLDSGIDESSLAVLDVTNIDPGDAVDVDARLESGLRRLPGMRAVTWVSAVPFGQGAGISSVSADPGGGHVAAVPSFYDGGADALRAMHVQLLAGHFPTSGDAATADDGIQRVYITQSLAQRLWPHGSALGRTFWYGGGRGKMQVMGVLQHFLRPSPRRLGVVGADWSVFTPGPAVPPGPYMVGKYLLRAAPAALDSVLLQARLLASQVAPNATVDLDQSVTVSQLRREYFREDRATVGVLIGIILALMTTTAMGIVGLTSFWVQKRRKQIGIRRALGARRRDILRHFQIENFMIVAFGVVSGVVLAYALNITMMHFDELPRLPIWYLPISAAVMWLLGQLAVLAPALRASRVPPIVATRSV